VNATPIEIPEQLDATLVLLRHGESTWVAEGRFQGRAEVPLSAIGRRQAELAAARLAAPHASPPLPVPTGVPVEIAHSPIARAAETAAVVGAAIGAPRRADPDLAEIGQGDWEGRTGKEIAERWGPALAAWRRTPLDAWAPGGESLTDVAARADAALGRALERLEPAAADGSPAPTPRSLDRPHVLGYAADAPDHPWSILVGHDGVFKVALLRLFGMPLERFWTFSFALCGMTVVEVRAGRATLRAHNLSDHLAPLLDERAQVAAEARERSGAL
jgi:probable phosphoglycerate mutase